VVTIDSNFCARVLPRRPFEWVLPVYCYPSFINSSRRATQRLFGGRRAPGPLLPVPPSPPPGGSSDSLFSSDQSVFAVADGLFGAKLRFPSLPRLTRVEETPFFHVACYPCLVVSSHDFPEFNWWQFITRGEFRIPPHRNESTTWMLIACHGMLCPSGSLYLWIDFSWGT